MNYHWRFSFNRCVIFGCRWMGYSGLINVAEAVLDSLWQTTNACVQMNTNRAAVRVCLLQVHHFISIPSSVVWFANLLLCTRITQHLRCPWIYKNTFLNIFVPNVVCTLKCIFFTPVYIINMISSDSWDLYQSGHLFSF